MCVLRQRSILSFKKGVTRKTAFFLEGVVIRDKFTPDVFTEPFNRGQFYIDLLKQKDRLSR